MERQSFFEPKIETAVADFSIAWQGSELTLFSFMRYILG